MTDNEIIKALEETANHPHYYEEGQILKNALDLIHRQKAEIDKLNAENMMTIAERNAFRTSFYDVSKQLKTTKSEAIKEFAERLKEKFHIMYFEYEYCHFCDIFDNLVKEMVGNI